MTEHRRILALDGGGIRGAFAASFLAGLEDRASHEFGREVKVGECFDLIVGTSTGGVIAIALGLGYSANQVVDLFRQLGPAVFKKGRSSSPLLRLFRSRYSDAPLRQVLQGAFQDRTLSDSRVRLVIPSLDVPTEQPRMFKTAHHPTLAADAGEQLVDVAGSTAAAPTYFPSHKLSSGVPLLDGGLYANNPIAIAAAEAIGILGWPRGSFDILSVGCTSQPPHELDSTRHGRGQYYWALRIVDVMQRVQSEAALGMAIILAARENVVRVDPPVEKGRFTLDGIEGIDALCALGNSEARHRYSELKQFLETPAEPFTPIANAG